MRSESAAAIPAPAQGPHPIALPMRPCRKCLRQAASDDEANIDQLRHESHVAHT